MKAKQLVITFVFYTIIMFLLYQFLIHPGKTAVQNLVSALVAGVLFIVLFGLYKYILKRRARNRD